MRKTIVLQNSEDGAVDAVIFASETTENDIENIMNKVRNEKGDDYQWEDFVAALPGDCILCLNYEIAEY